MDPIFVKATFDLKCDWEGLPPVYRIYVNDELFTERTWTWTKHYLNEALQIQALPGTYTVTVQPVGPNLAKFYTENHAVKHGPAEWIDSTHLRIN